jgi:hypothetical protein
MADIGPAPGEAIFIIAEFLQMFTPGLAPEAAGNLSPLDLDRPYDAAFFAELLHFPARFRAALAY